MDRGVSDGTQGSVMNKPRATLKGTYSHREAAEYIVCTFRYKDESSFLNMSN